MKIFITGGTGFVGTRLVARLEERGHQVLVLTRSDKETEALSASVRLRRKRAEPSPARP